MEERSATDLFAQYVDAKERGENPDFEALCAAHPEFAATLRARPMDTGRDSIRTHASCASRVHAARGARLYFARSPAP